MNETILLFRTLLKFFSFVFPNISTVLCLNSKNVYIVYFPAYIPKVVAYLGKKSSLSLFSIPVDKSGSIKLKINRDKYNLDFRLWLMLILNQSPEGICYTILGQQPFYRTYHN